MHARHLPYPVVQERLAHLTQIQKLNINNAEVSSALMHLGGLPLEFDCTRPHLQPKDSCPNICAQEQQARCPIPGQQLAGGYLRSCLCGCRHMIPVTSPSSLSLPA